MKHLPKHLRQRVRYLAVGLEAWPDADLDRAEFQGACRHAARDLLGDVGSAALDLSVLRFEFAEGTGSAVVRTRRGEVDRARAALACVDAVSGHPVGVHVRGVSGTVRACKGKYLGGRREETRQRHVVFGTAEAPAVERDGRVDVETDQGYTGATALDL